MKYPAFIAEIGRYENRANIQAGIYTGYATVASFGAIAWYAAKHGLIPASPAFAGLVIAKLVTNTISWVTLRAQVLHLEFATLNIAADLLVMTGTVYLTGGPNSPLLPIYFIEVAVMALMTNVGLTIVTIVASFLLFAGMCLAIRMGALPLLPTPFERLGTVTTAYLVTLVAAFAISMLAPGAYIAIIVQRLRHKETALEERARDLVEASKEKGQFMVNVTHELRTPLHGILGLSELIREGIYGPVTAKQIDGIAGIVYSAKNLLELIDALLLFARAEVTELDVVVAPVDIGEVASRVAATGRWLCGTKKLTIDVAVAPDLPVVDTDRARVTHILVNLLANAIKFTPEGGRVEIAARLAGDSVELVVSDTGIGIPERELDRIFEAFHQVDGSAVRAHGGVGLGLALVRRLAHSIEASVAVESTEGEGSTFTVRLPPRMSKSARVDGEYAPLPHATAGG